MSTTKQRADLPSDQGDKVEQLVGLSRRETAANMSKACHNATAKTADIIPYDNSATLALIDAVHDLLMSNNAHDVRETSARKTV